MRIQSVNNTSFGRKPNQAEMQVYTKALNKGLELLDKKLDIIIHNSAAPAVRTEDTGIGSLFSTTTQTKLIPFLKSHGFSGIQQEPNYLRKSNDPSPYAPESSAKNIYMIPLEKLTTEKYGKILPAAILDDIALNRPQGNKVNYKFVKRVYDTALKVSYEIFKKGDALKSEFAKFKKEYGEKLEKAAIYRILDSEYKTEWTKWPGIDKNLYAPRNEEEVKLAQARINEIKLTHQDDIDYFIFQQMLVDMENKESNELAKISGVKIIGDSPVAYPAADEWVNQNLYMEGKAIGCPPDYFAKDGQRWGFKYFKPDKIFNSDGTLGEAGKIMKKKYEDSFASFPGGLRIDHVIGLVDPFIYTVSEKKMTPQNSGRIYSEIGSKYKKEPKNYSNIVEKIVLAAARKFGMDKSSIICEDLGEPNNPTRMVMKKLGLSGVAVTQFGPKYRGSKVPKQNVIMIGSHDNESFLEYIRRLFHRIESRKELLYRTRVLAEDTIHSGASKEEISKYRKKIRNNWHKFFDASYAELFTSPAKRVQIFFSDFWGIGKTYNRPGTIDGNWALRIDSDFENEYYKAVSEGRAPNLAKAVATALRQRGLDKNHKRLIKNLDKSAQILDE